MTDSLLLIIMLSAILIVWYIAGSVYNRRVSGKALREVREQIRDYVKKIDLRDLGSGFILSASEMKKPIKALSITMSTIPRETPMGVFSAIWGRRDLISVTLKLDKPVPDFDVVNPKSPFKIKSKRGRPVILEGRPSKKIIELVDKGAWRIKSRGGEAYCLMPVKTLRGKLLREFVERISKEKRENR